MWFLFNNQCKISLKIKLKGNKGHKKAHNAQDSVKTLEIISSVACGIEAHIQGTRDIIKVVKCLYTLFQYSNTTNNDYMK